MSVAPSWSCRQHWPYSLRMPYISFLFPISFCRFHILEPKILLSWDISHSLLPVLTVSTALKAVLKHLAQFALNTWDDYTTKNFTICFPNKYYPDDQIKKNKIGGTCNTYGDRRGAYRGLLTRCKGERPLGRLGLDERIVGKWIFKNWKGKAQTG
jgi:hypothetical protein